MANRRNYKKDISVLCSTLAEELFFYNLLDDSPNQERAQEIMNKVIELHFTYRQKATTSAIKASGTSASLHFTAVWKEFSTSFESISEEIIQLMSKE
jgi:hypothetical protein